MNMSPLFVLRATALCLPLALTTSCGGTQAVQGSLIVINPTEIGQTTTPTAGAALVQEVFTIEIRSPSGAAQINTQILIETPGDLYSVDTSTPEPWTFTPVPSSYTTTTNSNGVVTVAVDFAVGPATEGEVTVISARSGTAYNRTNVTYTCDTCE